MILQAPPVLLAGVRAVGRVAIAERAMGAPDLDPAGKPGHQHGMYIYKILRAAEWQAFEAAGETLGAPIDLADGYIHFSTAEQAAETAAKWFAGVDGLKLLALAADHFGPALKWEPSRGGQLFPHLYGALKLADVIWVKDLPIVDGVHIFPKDMP